MRFFAAVLLVLVLGSAAAFFVWRSSAGPTVTLPTSGTQRMASRLQEVIRAWEETPFAMEEDAWFRANRPQWISTYRRKIEGNKDFQEVLMLRHKLALELLWDGQTEAAIPQLEWLFEAVSSSTTPPDLKKRLTDRIQRDVAISFLRLGEEENCLALHHPDSCLFPIRGGGVHTKERGARHAVEVLSAILASNPRDLGARWLLNLACMTLGEYPGKVPASWRIEPRVFQSDREIPRFPDIAGKLGVDMTGLAGGCSVEDFDGDGRLDIIASSWGLRDQLRYFRQKPDGTFEDRTEASGLEGEVGGLNICHADFDNDGAVDVLVLRGGWLGKDGRQPNSLLRNLGGGRFDDVTEEAGLLALEPTQTAAWGDFDGDGWLDLFVGCEQGKDTPGNRSRLYHNSGDGTFTDRAAECGLAELGFVKGAAWGDYDNDGRLDLYVSRIDQPNALFRNSGPASKEAGGESSTGSEPSAPAVAWTFQDVTQAAGVGEPIYSFPTWFFDYDNDGWLDIFAAGFDGVPIDAVAADYLGLPQRRGHPRLYRNRGDGTFEDVTRKTRLDRVLLVMGAGYGDLDGDGYLDMYLGTGSPDLRTLMPNRMFLGREGRAFDDVTTAGGFGHLQKGHGIAFADIDGDGDQDVYAVMGGWYTGDVFRNALFQNPGFGHHWITLRLRGRRSNRCAIGARVRVTVRTSDGTRDIHRVVDTGGSFGSSSLQQEIGLGQCLAIERVEIRWPAGSVQTIDDLELDHIVEVEEDVE